MRYTISENIILNDVSYIHEYRVNLISVSKLTLDNNLKINFNGKTCDFWESKLEKLIKQVVVMRVSTYSSHHLSIMHILPWISQNDINDWATSLLEK